MRLLAAALLLLLFLAVLPAQAPAHAQGTPRITVTSLYNLDRYGFATVNESVTFVNNGTSAVPIPSLTFGLGNLSSLVTAYNLTGSGFSLEAQSTGGPFTVSSGQTVQPGGNASYVLSALVNNVVTTTANGSLRVLTLSSPSISSRVDTLNNNVWMPASTSFETSPTNLTANIGGTTNTYTSTYSDVAPLNAVTSVETVRTSTIQDFNRLHVYYAERTISIDSKGTPLVTDTIEFRNMGSTPLTTLYVTPLAPAGTKATIETTTEPRLISPLTVTLVTNSIGLSKLAMGYPNNGVPAGHNFTITYQYPLGSSRYSDAGGQVSVNVPYTPPIRAFVDTYAIVLSLPPGATSSRSTPVTLQDVSPWQSGKTSYAYTLSVGWTIDGGVPLATAIFVMLLIALYASRTTAAEAQEEEEEESSSELAAAMIKAFDEKTNLINSLWPEVAAKDPNELDRAYFDDIRGRLDSFRSRALQRLNEVRQKSTSQRFTEVVGQIHVTEREVDRAAKDKLNLYQQYYLRQMRKEVYDRLLPQYTKRLERALNQLSDELHTVQREAKLL